MITVYSTEHRRRDARTELYNGQLVKPHECPQRAEYVLERVRQQRLGDIVAPHRFGRGPLERVHEPGYLTFLETVWPRWVAAGNAGEAIPDCWPARRMRMRCPQNIVGQLGYYAMAGETSISEGTWEAASASADVALTGARLLSEGASRRLCAVPPAGTPCRLRPLRRLLLSQQRRPRRAVPARSRRQRIAILDVDYHHGNGTQDIFYERADVLYLSLHAEPQTLFRIFWATPDETGHGAGEGFNLQFPMPPGTPFAAWREALAAALARIAEFQGRCAGGVTGRRHLRTRSDQLLQAGRARISRATAR